MISKAAGTKDRGTGDSYSDIIITARENQSVRRPEEKAGYLQHILAGRSQSTLPMRIEVHGVNGGIVIMPCNE